MIAVPRVRRHSALSAVSGRSDLRVAANTQQLRRQDCCSLWTSLVELSSGPAGQSRHHLRTVQTTAEGTPISGSMNTALCDFWYAAPYLLTYLLLWFIITHIHTTLREFLISSVLQSAQTHTDTRTDSNNTRFAKRFILQFCTGRNRQHRTSIKLTI